KAAYMTAAKLSVSAGVSEATVVRFAKRFGFEGYPPLQHAMQEMTRNSLTSLQRIEVTRGRIGDGDIMDSVIGHDIELIRRTLEKTSREQFDSAVELLCSARRIYIIGTRSASALASFMCYYLSLIFEQVSLIDPSNESEIFEQMLHIGEADAVVGISFPRYSRRAVKAMEIASSCGAKTIALTDSESSPLAQPADFLLLAQSDMASIVDSLVAPLSLINALLVATALRKKDELSEQFQRLERIWEEYDVYEKSDT
ncbi:MAG: MurR/RpiR family transcriptional regulator, partial [Clostridia bacterium]|nr:MurR/RpiR family transcriptional regulator [Clostridia bacterium]